MSEIKFLPLRETKKFKEEEPIKVAERAKKYVPNVDIEGITRVGIEIEVEGIPLSDEQIVDFNKKGGMKTWFLSKDGSLRNHGKELKSKGPLVDSNTIGFSFQELEKLFKQYSKTLDFSWRTSAHAHFCLREFNLPQLISLFQLYCFVEPYIFFKFAPNRRHSNFCVPIEESYTGFSLFRFIINALHNGPGSYPWYNDLNNLWSNDEKYSAINFSRIRDLGTVEFRHLMGEKDFDIVSEWISFLAHLIKAAFEQKPEDITEALLMMKNDKESKVFFENLFPLWKAPDQVLALGRKLSKEFIISACIKSNKSKAKLHPKKTGALLSRIAKIKKKRAIRLSRVYS